MQASNASRTAFATALMRGLHTRADLRGVGLSLIDGLTDVQLVRRYHPGGLNGLRPTSFSHTAHARVV